MLNIIHPIKKTISSYSVWNFALKVGISDFVQRIPSGLDTTWSSGGSDFFLQLDPDGPKLNRVRIFVHFWSKILWWKTRMCEKATYLKKKMIKNLKAPKYNETMNFHNINTNRIFLKLEIYLNFWQQSAAFARSFC